MYGLTYVIARDGYSGKIVGAATMSVKNNLVIYDKVYLAAVIEYGLWDQLRVDHGREFYLMLFIQEKLREQRETRIDSLPANIITEKLYYRENFEPEG